MKLARSLLGYRSPADEPTIRRLIRKSTKYKKEKEPVDKCQTLLIFQTSKQHTWLIASSRRLYCVLDDFRRPKPRYRWSMSTKKLKKGDYKIETRSHTSRTGLVDIGPKHTDWLYSKRLFGSRSIEDLIMDLVTEGSG